LRVDDDPIEAWPRDLERQIGGIDFDHIAVRYAPNAQVERALLQLELRRAVVDVGDDDAGRRAEPDGPITEGQLDASSIVRP